MNFTTLTLGNFEKGLFSKRLVLNKMCTYFHCLQDQKIRLSSTRCSTRGQGNKSSMQSMISTKSRLMLRMAFLACCHHCCHFHCLPSISPIQVSTRNHVETKIKNKFYTHMRTIFHCTKI